MITLKDHDNIKYNEIAFWMYVISCVVLVILAGVTSGLALGLLSFSQVDLEVLIKAGRPKDKKNAERILPVVKNGHFVLCTLLLGKSLAMEALPIFMDPIMPPWLTIIISTPLVTLFAEIVPQAVYSRYGLTLGAQMAPFVQLLLLIFFPISYPASKILDWALGKEHSVLLRRSELKTFVDLHADMAGKGGELSCHEASIITGAMDLTDKTAKDAMTPISETFSLDINSKLDMNTMTLIMNKGHSRVPLYSGYPSNIIGLILVKNLMFCRPEDETPIKNLIIRKIPRVYENWPLYEILNQFQKGHSHMAIVLKCENDSENNNAVAHAAGAPTFLNTLTNKISNATQNTKESDSSFDLEKSQRVCICESSDIEFNSPSPAFQKMMMEAGNEQHQHSKKWEEESGYTMSQEEIQVLPTVLDEEVIGIITMEDVMEELLQGDILDETDEYVHVQKNIRINLLTPRRSSRKGSESSLH
ncbi:hypothetical protein HN51_057138 [Arachis hypogaea]|uniref:CNNM transmembrane domain-containing protein n=1 Tax=Arachis hypogaea TaxID=3818 RepID=A0A444XW91_ARAHY|nr:DUF21 domain-containing protein At2g14520-like [Arachis ipaensis]XP_025677687.1 DUF21 domain-containing protein At2g14520-like [Arachis hypogaea]RYQ94069.1 hypothetical protein Ahy_B09g100271 [Arachis hypogaea]